MLNAQRYRRPSAKAHAAAADVQPPAKRAVPVVANAAAAFAAAAPAPLAPPAAPRNMKYSAVAGAQPPAKRAVAVVAKAAPAFPAAAPAALAAPAADSPRKTKHSGRSGKEKDEEVALRVLELPSSFPPLSEADREAQRLRRAKKKTLEKERVSQAAEETKGWPLPPTKVEALEMKMVGAIGSNKASIMSFVMAKHEVLKKRYEVVSSRPDGFKLKCPFAPTEGCGFACTGGFTSFGAGACIYLHFDHRKLNSD